MKRLLALAAALLVLALGGGALTTASAQPVSPKPPPRHNLGAITEYRPLESVYHAVRPCRIADTRSSSAGIISHSTSRAFYVRGSAGFAGQGGSAAGCQVPVSATAVTVNATVTGATGPGFLVNFPTGSTEPLSNFVSFQKAVTITANPTFALAGSPTEPSLQIHASGTANAHLILDVTGYYLPQIEAYVRADGTVAAPTTPRIVSSRLNNQGAYEVTVDTDVSTCSAVVTPWLSGVAGIATTGGSAVYVQTFVTTNGNSFDAPFNLVVSC